MYDSFQPIPESWKFKKVRDYLVFCSTNHGKAEAELFGGDRLFDVALHDYSSWVGTEVGTFRQGEYWFPFPKYEKFEAAAEVIPALPSYKYYAFLDDDLSISTDALNRLFQVGNALKLDLYQPALTKTSFSSHPHLYEDKWARCPIKEVPFVEIMCPFFSKDALDKCLPTFNINSSAWGLDIYMWPERAQGYLINNIPIGHYRQPGRRGRVLRSGLTPHQELWIMTKIFHPEDCSMPPV